MSFRGLTDKSFYVFRLAINEYYESLSKIEMLERLEKENSANPNIIRAISEEKQHLMKDTEDVKKYVKECGTSLSQLIYLRYFEGYTLEEIANELKLSYNNVKKVHANFARYCKSKENVHV